MGFTQPTLHHILYVESDSLQITRHGFLKNESKSIWLNLDSQDERDSIDRRLAGLHQTGRIKLYVVSACDMGDDSDIVGLQDELDALERCA